MKYINTPFPLLFALLFLGSACTHDFPDEDPTTVESAGEVVDLTKYVAVGNSLTAGLMDGALYNRGQENSLANIIAQQFQEVGGGTFNQPDINAENGYFTEVDGTIFGRLKLAIVNGSPTPTPTSPGDAITAYSGDVSALNNFGVPGAKASHTLVEGYGLLNPYYARFASDASTSSIIGDAVSAGGTFFTLWLGNNDVLDYAIAGATEEDDLTSISEFTTAYTTVMSQMLANGAKGVVANIPDVTNIPYFTTIPYNALSLDATTAAQLNAGYSAQIDQGIEDIAVTTALVPAISQELVYTTAYLTALAGGATDEQATALATAYIESEEGLAEIGALTNAYNAAYALDRDNPTATDPYSQDTFDIITASVAGLLTDAEVQAEIQAQTDALQASGEYPVFVEGDNPFLIDDETSLTGFRFMTENELVVLTTPLDSIQTWLLNAQGIPDEYILTEDEISTIQTRTTELNAVIAITVSDNSSNVGLVDMNSILATLAASGGTTINGIGASISITPPYGLFSLDGIHPNGRGSAYMANQFITTINATFDANIPLVNENDYHGNDLPE